MKKLAINILLGVIASLIATAIYFLLEYALGKPLEGPPWFLVLAIGLIFLAVLFSAFGLYLVEKVVSRRIRPKVEQEVRKDLEKEVREILEKSGTAELEAQTGIIKIFPNFPACEKELLEHVATSDVIKVFLQIGKTVLGGTTNFYEYLGSVTKPSAIVRILHASMESPYLSERIALVRNSDFNEWSVDLEHALRKVETLTQRQRTKLESRQHKEGFVWRLFIFDELAYVQPYLYPRNNSESAPVIKISRLLSSTDTDEANPNSLYKAFSSYFDFKWDEYRPDTTSLSEFIPPNDESAVAVIAKYSQFYIFAIPARYIKPESKEVPFHGIGGKCKPGEHWLEAIKRESQEEIGVEIEIESSARTRFHTTGAELPQIDLNDSPRPYCVYKRTREVDPNFVHPDLLWLVGYEAKLNLRKLDELRPRAEVGALLCLTGDMLIKILYNKVTYQDIDNAKDGSRLILGNGVSFDKSLRAVPAGLAIIVATEQRPRLARRL